MPRTPDRFPGERDEEGLVLEDQGPAGLAGGDPGAQGFRFVTDRFKMRDALGVFNPRATYTTVSDPTVNDDDSDGFSVGCIWLNTVSGKSYILRSNTIGSAVWAEITSGGGVDDVLIDEDTLQPLVDDETYKFLVDA